MEVTTAERHASGGPGKELAFDNAYQAFLATVERLGDELFISSEAHGAELSFNEVRDQSQRIAGGLNALGVGKGDTVALMLNNRPEFIAADLGAVALGAVPFSIYQTSTPEQIAYVVGDAGAKVAFIEKAFADVFAKAREELPDLEHVIVIDSEDESESLAGLEAKDPGFDPSDHIAQVGLDDFLTLIYTSGTTGPPKGVQLTHRNL